MIFPNAMPMQHANCTTTSSRQSHGCASFLVFAPNTMPMRCVDHPTQSGPKFHGCACVPETIHIFLVSFTIPNARQSATPPMPHITIPICIALAHFSADATSMQVTCIIPTIRNNQILTFIALSLKCSTQYSFTMSHHMQGCTVCLLMPSSPAPSASH